MKITLNLLKLHIKYCRLFFPDTVYICSSCVWQLAFTEMNEWMNEWLLFSVFEILVLLGYCFVIVVKEVTFWTRFVGSVCEKIYSGSCGRNFIIFGERKPCKKESISVWWWSDSRFGFFFIHLFVIIMWNIAWALQRGSSIIRCHIVTLHAK